MVFYLNEAAKAKAQYNELGKELLLHLQRVQAGWFADDPHYVTVRKIELKSRMNVLQRKHGKEW
jgi:hypothetical protein